MGYVEELLAENEKIVIETRQHWRVLAVPVLMNGFFFILLVSLALFLEFIPLFPRYRIGVLLGLILLALAILPILALLREFLEWRNEEYIVTNRRVIQAQGILGKHVIDSSLEMVNDVVLSQSFLGRLLNYGDIEILTASEVGVNLFRTIADPVKFKMAMMNQRQPTRGTATPETPNLIKELDELHEQGLLTDQEYREKKRQLLARM